MSDESGDDDDTYTREGYRRRAAWFDRTRDERTGEGHPLTPGGSGSTELEMEVKSNYINANFLSTIITASSVIEGMLFRQVIQCDPDRRQEKHTLHGVFNLATKYDILSEDVTDAFNSLNEIRDLRNGVVHYREGHEEDALVFQHHMENMMETHPNKYGKEYAEKTLKAMFDIKAKCAENERKFWDHEGPLRQGINTIQTGKEAYCDTCGGALKDTKLNYEAEWDGCQVVSEYAECHECGENVISVFTDS